MPVPTIEYETAERQVLDAIRDWHRSIVEALLDHRASVLRAIREGSVVPSRFRSMTEGDVDEKFDGQRRELDRLTMLNLVACAEATIAIDYFRRVGEKLRDPLSIAYRGWHKTLSARKQLRPDFDERGILDVLRKDSRVDKNTVRRFRECLLGRHWVGHGRRWDKPIAVDRLDTDDVYDRCNALLLGIPP